MFPIPPHLSKADETHAVKTISSLVNFIFSTQEKSHYLFSISKYKSNKLLFQISKAAEREVKGRYVTFV
jgi:hypothetical protein